MDYPVYYIIKCKMAQPILDQVLAQVAEHRQYIQRVRDTRNEKSKKIELILKPGLKELGYLHSVTNRTLPLFHNGSQFELDFFHPRLGTAIEIERSNLYTKVWLALFKMLESDRVHHGLILVPLRRTVRKTTENSFELTYKRLRDNAHNLLHHLDSLVVVGY